MAVNKWATNDSSEKYRRKRPNLNLFMKELYVFHCLPKDRSCICLQWNQKSFRITAMVNISIIKDVRD